MSDIGTEPWAWIGLGLLGVSLFVYAYHPEAFVAPGLTALRRWARLKRTLLDVDGEPWRYLRGGPAEAETVLLLHGFGADKDSWILYARGLSARFHVVVPDLPGFGESPQHLDREYTLDVQVERMLRFMDCAELDRVHLVGNSMGGAIAALLTARVPKRICSLTLMNNLGVAAPVRSELMKAIDRGENPLVVGSMEEFNRLLDFVSHRKIWLPDVFKRVALSRLAASRDFFDSIVWSLVKDGAEDALAVHLSEIEVPTLIIWGRHDRLMNVSCVNIMADKIPDSRTWILDDAGHVPMIEFPLRVARQQRRFLEGEPLECCR